MDEEKEKFKKVAIAAWKQHLSIQTLIEMTGRHPSPSGEAAWRAQYAAAGSPNSETENGFRDFVVTTRG